MFVLYAFTILIDISLYIHKLQEVRRTVQEMPKSKGFFWR